MENNTNVHLFSNTMSKTALEDLQFIMGQVVVDLEDTRGSSCTGWSSTKTRGGQTSWIE